MTETDKNRLMCIKCHSGGNFLHECLGLKSTCSKCYYQIKFYSLYNPNIGFREPNYRTITCIYIFIKLELYDERFQYNSTTL